MTDRIRALLVYAALAALLFVPALAGGRIFSFRDLADFNLPHKRYGAEMLRAGSIPLWNPYNFCGYPHLANLQSGVLYPPNLFIVLLPFAIGFNLSVVLHFVIAALGARALARSLGIGAGGALVAGVAYGFSPLLVSMLDLLPPLGGAAWLPWALAAGIAIGRTPSPRRIATGAVVLGLSFLAGEPLYFGLALGGMIPAAVVAAGRGRAALAALGAIGAVAVALLLVAPVLLPFLELVAHSERAGAGLTREQALRDSLAPAGMLALVVPPRPGGASTGEVGGQSYIRRPYLGLTVALLAAVGLLCGAGRDIAGRVLGGLAVVLGVVLALGGSGGLYPLLYDLGFRQSRFPMKFLVVTLLALALLAARGAEWILARRPRLSPALAGLVALDLVLAARPVVTTGSAAALLAPGPTADAIAALDPGAGATCAWPRVYPPPYTAEALRFIAPEGRADDDAIARKKALLIGNTNLYAGLASAGGGDSMEVRATTELLDAIARGPVARPLLDLTGAGWFVTTHDLAGLGFVERWSADGVRLYANPQALPHAFLVGRTRAGLDQVFAADFDPRREASVDDATAASIGDLSTACAEGSARVVSCAAREVAIETEAAGRCLLVLTDTYYPGWEAEVDGAEGVVIRADHAFRGVVVAAGKHEVRFAYRPRSFAIGLWLFAAGLVALVVLVALPATPRMDRRATAKL